MASRVLGDCEALAALRFRHLGEHFLKPGNSYNISFSRILHFVHSAGLLNALQRAAQKINCGQSSLVTLVPILMYSNLI